MGNVQYSCHTITLLHVANYTHQLGTFVREYVYDHQRFPGRGRLELNLKASLCIARNIIARALETEFWPIIVY